jgi:hypothetical protein
MRTRCMTPISGRPAAVNTTRHSGCEHNGISAVYCMSQDENRGFLRLSGPYLGIRAFRTFSFSYSRNSIAISFQMQDTGYAH